MPDRANSSKIKATIMVFFYKQEQFVEQCLASIFAEDLSDLEVIISDDCSPDSTFAKCNAFVQNNGHNARNLILNRNEENLGITGHINKLVGLANSDIFFPVAGDDWIAKRKFEILLGEAADSPCSMMVSDLFRVNEHGVVLNVQRCDRNSPWDALTVARKGVVNVGGNAQCMWRRELFDVFGPLPTYVNNEDDQLIFRATLLHGVGTVARPLNYYRMHGASVSGWWRDKNVGHRQYCTRLANVTDNIEATYRGWIQSVKDAGRTGAENARLENELNKALARSIDEIVCLRAVLKAETFIQRLKCTMVSRFTFSNHYFKLRMMATLSPYMLYLYQQGVPRLKFLLLKLKPVPEN